MRRIALLSLFSILLPIFSLKAQEVDLLWQGETYTPPLYHGRPLWSNESRVTLVAIARGTSAAPSAMYYKWSKNGTVLGSSSGIGKTSITLPDTILSLPIEVRVDVLTGEGEGVQASASVSLTPIAAKLLVYEDNPLYGPMLHRAVLEEFALTEPEVTFTAIPLFSTVSMRNAPAMIYAWVTNTGDSRSGSTVTYRAPEDASGSSRITLRARNSRVLTEPAPKNFLVKFGQNNDF